MAKVFINHTNHPSTKWPEQERREAEAYGDIVDIPFPAIGADWDEQWVWSLAEENCRLLLAKEPAAVLCQGEFCYTYRLVQLLQENGIKALAATSERVAHVEVAEDGTSTTVSRFEFVRFRAY